MTRDWNELHEAEDPAVELLTKGLGYTYIAPEVLEKERERQGGLGEPLLRGRLAAALRRLNPWLDDEGVASAIRIIAPATAASLIEVNRTIHGDLTTGVSVLADRGDGRRNHQVRFFDFSRTPEGIAANEWLVTRQFRLKGGRNEIIPDLVVFVNGIPLTVIECKSPKLGKEWRSEAIKQLRRYQEVSDEDEWRERGAPRLFYYNLLMIGCCGQGACYGAVTTPSGFYLDWPEPYPLSKDALAADRRLAAAMPRGLRAQEITLYSLLARDNLLEFLRDFVIFEVEKGRLIKKLARYRQRIAVAEAVKRITERPTSAKSNGARSRGGVIWHTQGSGKSLTMVWLALKLRRDPALKNPTLVVVTDRNDLDRQLSDTFTACNYPVERAGSIKDLKALLHGSVGQTVFTTIQKFQERAAPELTKAAKKAGRRTPTAAFPELNAADNIVVLVDEAHRTQYLRLAANLRAALPNAALIGFTGTPLDKRDRSTRQTFGPYIDTYTIAQAVADNATVPIFYEGRLPELSIVGKTLDRVFEHLFRDLPDKEKAELKRRYGNEHSIAEAPQRISAIALDLIEHFRAKIEPGGFKAQVVACTRLAAARYGKALRELGAPDFAVIYSPAHNDVAEIRDAQLDGATQRKVIERFKDPDDKLKIIVVCDMLLTGFDAPVEQVLYLDAPLREHTLLQAIARTNRLADGKQWGLIVDYWGVSTRLKEALEIFAPDEVEAAMTPTADEEPRLQVRHQAAIGFFSKVKDKSDLTACIDAVAPADVRDNFEEALRRFMASLDILYPDPRALAYVDDARWLVAIRQGLRARDPDPSVDLSDYGTRMRKLIADAVAADDVRLLVERIPLLADDFEAKIAAIPRPEAKASAMEHALRREIHLRLDEDPVFYESLRERLEKIIADAKAKRIVESEELQLMFQLRTEVASGRRQSARSLGISPRAFAIMGLLGELEAAGKLAGLRQDPLAPSLRDLAAVIDDDIEPYTKMVEWDSRDDIQKTIRRKIKDRLMGRLDYKTIEKLAEKIVGLARPRST